MVPELDVYARQGLGRTAGIGQRIALLVVDFVVGFNDPNHFGGGNIGDAIAATAKFLPFARSRRWPIAHTRVVYSDDGSDGGAFALKAPSLLKLTEHSHLSQFVEPVKPSTGEFVIRKRQASAFFGTELLGWLTFRHVDTLLVSGCTTSGCVRASVVDAVSSNLRTVVLTDCVGDRALGPHQANLFDMGQKYADLMTSAQIIGAIGQQ